MNAVISLLIALVLAVVVWFGVGSGSNVEFLKTSCPQAFQQAGWEPTGYAGYEWGFGGFGTSYGGAKVWWYVRSPTSRLNYQGFCKRWGNETHLYGPLPTEKNIVVN